jgi:hypothetical protein
MKIVSVLHDLFKLTLNLLTTNIVAPPSNASKWQMGFNSAFKGLMDLVIRLYIAQIRVVRLVAKRWQVALHIGSESG